ncbi:hypothetical protein BD413DRAFT_589425 [Trametes elegans]|nr:hypothetical protein BD413DRAFT_589425 [Trametes elegans]
MCSSSGAFGANPPCAFPKFVGSCPRLSGGSSRECHRSQTHSGHVVTNSGARSTKTRAVWLATVQVTPMRTSTLIATKVFWA